MPAEFAAQVFDRLCDAGANHSLGQAGYFAIGSLRMEKGYRHWGHDIGPEDNPFQAGLGFTVKLDKQGGFIGRDALLRAREKGAPTRRLVQIRMHGDNLPMLYHDEPVWADGRMVGAVTSGSWGHRIGASLGMGYVEHPDGVSADWLIGARIEVEVAGRRHPATAQLKAHYDPANERVKA